MMMGGIPDSAVREIVARALSEDVGPGDITTVATVDADARCRASIVCKAEGVIAGLAVTRLTFTALDPDLSFEAVVSDGERVAGGEVVARIAGRTRAILTGERVALNFLQRMSGIATLTARYVGAVEGTETRICDTRKTAPGLRLLDKYAVRVGGGHSHRVGLFDGILIKDNHIAAAGGIAEAVRRARASSHHLVNVEVEAQSLKEVEEALAAGVDVMLLDNMEVADIARAVGIARGRCELEASGGVTLDTVGAVARCGVDYISVGELTHSAPALDLALEVLDEWHEDD
jgi:nicotinate-nucleotide pyrophosphorylase (carboxylating)